MLPRIDPRTSFLTALCITLCSNLSFCLQILICLHLSSFMFSNFRFVPRHFYSLFIIIDCALSVFLVAFSCFNVSFLMIFLWSYYMYIKHVCSPKLTAFTVSFVYALLNGFLLLFVNRLIMKQTWMYNL